jgi:hypothetical protein
VGFTDETAKSRDGDPRSGFCAFWLLCVLAFLWQPLIWGFHLPLDSPEYTRQPK